jgi:copper transporter 1
MQMLFTWNTKDLCIVFKWWHIRSTFSLVASLIAVVALVAGYEALREGIRRYEAWVNKRADTAPRKFDPVYISASENPRPSMCQNALLSLAPSRPYMPSSFYHVLQET